MFYISGGIFEYKLFITTIVPVYIHNVALFLMIFDSPCHKLSQILDPLKVCHTLNKKLTRSKYRGDFYNYYYILNNNKKPIKRVFMLNPVWKTQDLLIKLKHEGVHFDRRGSFRYPDIFAKYLDFNFHMYVYETLLEIFERYFEIEASRVSNLFLTSLIFS